MTRRAKVVALYFSSSHIGDRRVIGHQLMALIRAHKASAMLQALHEKMRIQELRRRLLSLHVTMQTQSY